MVISLWTCKACGWQGFIRTGHQFAFQVLPDGEVQGPFNSWLDTMEALKKAPKDGGLRLTVKAKCPICDSWDMTKEDVPMEEDTP